MSDELLADTPTTLTEEQAIEADRQIQEATAIVEQDRLQQQQALEEQPIEPVEKDPGFIADNPIQAVKEVGAAVVGGGIDAIESVGSFADLVGDTGNYLIRKTFGGPIYDDQNPFSDEYIPNESKWLDIPDYLTPENKTGLGKLARGLVEFGVLAVTTRGIGGGAKVATKGAQTIYRTSRSAGFGIKGSRAIAFLPKGAVIAGEGSIADLVSNSSEMANIANLVNEHAPWIPFSEALAIDPEKDNPWLARIKSVTAGAGINLVGYGLVGAIRGAWGAARKLKSGADVPTSNRFGNEVSEKSISQDGMLDELAAQERAADAFENGKGISQADNYDEFLRENLEPDEYSRYSDSTTSAANKKALKEIADKRAEANGQAFDWEQGGTPQQLELELGRTPNSAVNPDLFPDSARSTYRPLDPDPVTKNLHEAVENYKAGGEPGGGYGPMWTETSLNRTAGDNLEFRKFLEVEGNKLAKQLFDNVDNMKDFRVVRRMFKEMVEDIWSRLEDGGVEATKRIEDYFKTGDNGNSYRVGFDGKGDEIVTANASQKLALQFVIASLGKQVQSLGAAARDLAPHASIKRQYEQSLGALHLAIREHKKSSYMAGSELALHAGKGVVPANRVTEIQDGISRITKETDEYFKTLETLNDKGAWRLQNDLMALHELSDGKVRTLNDIHEYLRALLVGGRMNGQNIPARWRTEMRSVFYNSILSGPRTPAKAVFGTNLIGMLRPFQAYYGSFWKGDKKQMLIAAAQIDALGKAMAESWQMAIHNWKLGVNRKSQMYQSKFDFAKDIEDFKASGEFFEKYGTKEEKFAFNGLNAVLDLNNNPWMRYTQNAMGAGDAFARTVIGRYEMRLRSAQKAIESGVDLNDVRAWADKHEELFRREIFKQDQDGMWVVSDKAARLAGDEAAMTKALEGRLAGLEQASQMPGMRAFFPFVRTGYNALRLSWAHTPLEKFTHKWHDIMKGENLHKYGIRDVDLPQAQALMRGRVAMGNSLVFMASVAAMSGLMTGDRPRDKAEREQWRLNKIEPNSFKFGNTYVSYKNIEPFNTILSATANVWTHSDALGDDTFNEMLEKLVWMGTAVIVDKSMLAGVEDLATVLAADTSTTQAERISAKFVRSHLPYSGLLSQIGEIMDANRKEADGFWETIWERDFIFKSMMSPKYDILSKDRSGKPLIPSAESPLLRMFNAVSPIGITMGDNDPVKAALKEINFNMPEIMTEYKGVPLRAEERSLLSKYMSQSDLRTKLNRLITSQSWKSSVNDYKKNGLLEREGYDLYKTDFYQQVRKLFLQAKRDAMRQLRFNNPELAEKFERREAKHRIIGSGNYDQIQNLMAIPK